MNKLFDLKGMNLWILGIAVGLNFLLSLLIVVGTYAAFSFLPQTRDLLQLIIMIVYFLGSFLIGWFSGRMAADLRGISYGLLGAFGGCVPAIPLVISGGIYGVMILLVILAGGFNGGAFSMRKLRRN